MDQIEACARALALWRAKNIVHLAVPEALTTYVEKNWKALVPEVEVVLAIQAKNHDARVTELLEANNREVERRRAAESALSQVRGPACNPQSTVPYDAPPPLTETKP